MVYLYKLLNIQMIHKKGLLYIIVNLYKFSHTYEIS